MKFLLLLLVILLGAWLWRSRRRPPPSATERESPSAEPQDMVACALCGMHVPRGEAEVGKHGLYCGVEHRQRAEP